MNSKMKKYISALLFNAMILSFTVTTPVFADSYSVVSVTPGVNSNNVSVLDDILITFDREIDSGLLTEENFVVTSEGKVPEYEIEKNGVEVEVKFKNALDYNTDYNFTLKNISEEKSVDFTTEENPITLLFKEDFSSTDSLNRFTNTGDQSKNFRLEGGALCVDASGAWAVGYGAIASIKDSESWRDYELSAEYKTRRYSSPIVAYRQVGVDTSKAENQTKYGYFVSGGTYAAPEDNPNHLYVGWQNVGTGGGNGIFSQAYTNASLEKNYGMRITAIGNKQKAENYDLSTGEVLNSIEREIADYDYGAIGFGVYYDFTYYDNIKVIDKGWGFVPNNIKNTGNTISLIFNDNIDTTSVTNDKVIVKKDGLVVESKVTATSDNAVDVKITDAEVDTVYEITVSKDILRASDASSMCSDKTFKIKTSEDGSDLSPIELLGITPADGAKNESIYSDPVITFTSEPIEESVKEHITVSSVDGNVPEYYIEVKGTNAYIRFKTELSNDSTYTIFVSDGIENYAGAVTSVLKTVSFTTESSEENILFEEDFTGDTTVPKEFIRKGTTHENNCYSVEGNSLKIGGTGNWEVGNSPYAMICGSESWGDYKIIAEYKDRQYSAGVVAIRQQVDTSVETEGAKTEGYFVRSGQYEEKNGAQLEIYKEPGVRAAAADATAYPEVVAYERIYRVEIEAIGSTIKAKTYDKLTDTLVQEVEYTDSDNKYPKGAIGFGALWDFTYWDNIKVIDKGLSFKTTQKKNVDGSFSMIFDRDLDPDSIDGNIIITDAEGNQLETKITLDGTDKIDVAIDNPEDGSVYNVLVKKEVSDLNGSTMTMDKNFNIIISMPYVVDELCIADENGKTALLTAGGKVNATAKINYKEDLDYSLIMIVYDETGAMYDIAYSDGKATGNGTVTVTTSDILLPQDVTGYRASAFLVDSMKNIKLLTKSMKIPN